ncbi:hypothetical protein X989_5104 [Burkholderia pseudomallei MSHR4378]|nr:hypothetical protein X989_5104 [Burkholderia pseudomallei MSHR4378]
MTVRLRPGETSTRPGVPGTLTAIARASLASCRANAKNVDCPSSAYDTHPVHAARITTRSIPSKRPASAGNTLELETIRKPIAAITSRSRRLPPLSQPAHAAVNSPRSVKPMARANTR